MNEPKSHGTLYRFAKLTIPILIIIAIIGVGAYFLFLQGLLKEADSDERYQALEKKLAEMSQQLEAYAAASSKQLEAVREAQTKVENDIAHVSVPALPSQDQQIIEELKSKVEQLEADLAKRQDQVAKIPETLSLFEKLHDRMQASKPFDKELEESKILFSTQDEDMQKRLSVLDAYGKEGVPTVEQLSISFRSVAKELMRLSIPDDIPWYERLAHRLRNLVIIRKHGQDLDESSPVNERIDGILYLLEIGNIEGAMSEAESLPEFKSSSYADWLKQAEKRLYIEQSLPIMEAHALAHVLTGAQDEKPKGE